MVLGLGVFRVDLSDAECGGRCLWVFVLVAVVNRSWEIGTRGSRSGMYGGGDMCGFGYSYASFWRWKRVGEASWDKSAFLCVRRGEAGLGIWEYSVVPASI